MTRPTDDDSPAHDQPSHTQAQSDSPTQGEALRRRAQELLELSLGPDAEFRPDQWRAIDRLVTDRDRLLLVQRTGWGKSTVYFIATKLLRERGEGPTVIVSPLLALMRNQVRDAETQFDLDAWTINSNNRDEWKTATTAVLNGECDILLISPERLAKEEFRETVMAEIKAELGLLVVDEAHCISDWGHDFRPDYRRIGRILNELPAHVPVAATTATANDRVVEDVTRQVPDLDVIRGDLIRESLRIQAIDLGSRARRLGWLAENVPDLPGSGVVYCLTTDDCEMVAEWLRGHGLDFEAYHGRMDGDRRQELEDQLLANDVDGLVATNALGMGFNKPDLGWVVHFQRPPNLIRYYQEIGRAGRGLDEAFAVVLSGSGDDRIAESFIEDAFPEPEAFETVLDTLAASDEPLTKRDILRRANVSWKAVAQCLDTLNVEDVIHDIDDGYERTGRAWSYDHDRIESVTRQRFEELHRIQEFVRTDACLARFIDDELDGTLEAPCGRCANCAGPFVPDAVQDETVVERAVELYQTQSCGEIDPRYYLYERDGRSAIADERKPEPGRFLCRCGDPGYGTQVAEQLEGRDRFDQALVDAAVSHIEDEWRPDPEPTWVAPVPSVSDDGRVADLARRIASELGLDIVDAVELVEEIQPQQELANSYQQRWNVEGAFEVTDAVRDDPVLLVDDTVRSRWTFTEVAMTLRDAGSGPVFPFALAERTKW